VRSASRRVRLDALVVALAALAVAGPALASHDGFNYDYTNHLWLVWVQGHAISAGGLPTYFLHTDDAGGGVFNPFFLFYGGTLYALAGALSAALGDSARIAFVGVTAASVAAAYGGTLWLSRQLGARSWAAHAPAVTYVASAYYVTNLYGRGAWPEFVAVSAIPLLVAAGTQIARAERPRPLPCVLLVAGVVVWSGSHNITLLWGGLVIVATLATLRGALGRPLCATRRRAGLLLWLAALAVCLNAWFLVPNVVNAGDTRIAGLTDFDWGASRDFNSPWALFDPLRHVPASSTTPALYVQAPVWLLVWATAALVVLRGRLTGGLRRAVLACGLVLGGLLALIMVEPLWRIVPAALQLIQIPYRLNSYVALLVAGLVLLAVLALQDASPGRRRRLLAGALAGAMTVSVGLAAWQLWVPETRAGAAYADLRDALVSDHAAPRTWYSAGAYNDHGARLVADTPGRMLRIDPAAVSGNDARLVVTPPPGRRPFTLNLGASPRIVDIDGIERVGRTRAGLTVARRSASAAGPVTVTIEPAGGAARTGQVVSLLALVGLVATAVAGVAGRVRRRRPVTARSAA
jgi:hypothetical protein